MWIAVLSGKGGTGKTTVAASLAAALEDCRYVDCDVEEPNGAIFLQPEIVETIAVDVLIPQADTSRCTGCGACAATCQFNALAVIGSRVLVFPEICHHCGACGLVCPVGAISEIKRPIGVVEHSGDQSFWQGRLNIGEPAGIPIIAALKAAAGRDGTVVFDCPPGASCSVVHALAGVDYCLLVTEPTPFGQHDLGIAWELVQQLGLHAGVIINKAQGVEGGIHAFCREQGLDILLEIPFSEEIARHYSRGILPVGFDRTWTGKFQELHRQIGERVEGCAR